jgi:hypothetical protein
MQLTDGERGRLDRSRRRPADGTAPLAYHPKWSMDAIAPTVRRDAEQGDRDGRAPVFQLRRSGLLFQLRAR